MNFRYIFAIAVLAVNFASTTADAGTVTIDFEDVAATGSGYNTNNLSRSDFRFSPTCHIDVGINSPRLGSTMLGWDRSGCDLSFNSNFLGAANSYDGSIYIDYRGSLFSLLSVDALVTDMTTGGTFRSSKGGVAIFNRTSDDIVTWSFNSDEWRNVEWVTVTNGGGGPNWYMDAITLSTVAEPAALPLLAIAAFAAMVTRNRRTQLLPKGLRVGLA